MSDALNGRMKRYNSVYYTQWEIRGPTLVNLEVGHFLENPCFASSWSSMITMAQSCLTLYVNK